MLRLTLSPAYGRDYKSAKAVQADFDACLDFTIETFFSPYCGKPCNRQDLLRDGYKVVQIRYNKLMSIANIKVKGF